jgi:hypothetical protein
MMIRTYLMKFMLQQSESRFFGFFIFIFICFCGCCFLLDVLLPLLLLLLLWFVVPFLADLFGAIALLVFFCFTRIFLLSRLIQLFFCVFFSCFIHCRGTHIVNQNQIFNSLTFFRLRCLQSKRFCAFSHAFFSQKAELIAFEVSSTLNFNNCRFLIVFAFFVRLVF